jgi:exopolyphosphatase/guanosine-5'-triphosphate,3'-diphosphate pyrophosphatase
MSYAQRVAQPCIGQERADLVLAGCAILEALLRVWPCQRLRVADRGLREGILATLMAEDGHGASPRHRYGNSAHTSRTGR